MVKTEWSGLLSEKQSLLWVDLWLGGDGRGRGGEVLRGNWWVTHNQPPYRSPTKLDCIHILVIHPDLANFSYSFPKPRQLCVIRARPGLYFPLSLDCYSSTPPSTVFTILSLSWHCVRWRGRKGFVDRVCPNMPLLLPHLYSVVTFYPVPFSCTSVSFNGTQEISPQTLIFKSRWQVRA